MISVRLKPAEVELPQGLACISNPLPENIAASMEPRSADKVDRGLIYGSSDVQLHCALVVRFGNELFLPTRNVGPVYSFKDIKIYDERWISYRT